MNRAALFLTATALCTTAVAQSLEFKGVPFGATQETFLAAHPTYRCEAMDSQTEMTVCMVTCSEKNCTDKQREAARYADEPVTMIAAGMVKGKFERLTILFEPRKYDAIRDAMIVRFGSPKHRAETEFKTMGGVSATNETVAWDLEGALIKMDRYGSRITSGRLNMHSATDVANMEEKAKSRAPKRQSNM